MEKGNNKLTRGRNRQNRSPFRSPLVLVVLLLVLLAAASALMWGANRADTVTSQVTEFMHIHGLAVSNADPSALYVASHEGLIRVYEDSEWHYVGTSRDDFMGFTLAPGDTDHLMYASGHPAYGSGRPNPAGLRMSRDGGETWNEVSLVGEVDFHALAVSPVDTRILYGWFAKTLFRSTDSGKSWERITVNGLEAAGGNLLAIAAHGSEPDHLIAGTSVGIARSKDGGRTWKLLFEGGAGTAVLFDPTDPRRILASVMVGDRAALFESLDNGATWNPLSEVPLQVEREIVAHIAVSPADPSVVYAGTSWANLYRSSDGGRTWNQLADRGTPLKPGER